MKKSLRYLRRIYHMSRMKQELSPMNSTIGTITRMAYLFSGMAAVYFAYSLLPVGARIHGAGFMDSIIIFLLFQSCFYMLNTFFFNLHELQLQIHRGQFDDKQVRPISSYLGILLQELYPHSLRSGFFAVIMVIILCSYTTPLTLFEWSALGVIFLSSVLILSALNLCFNAAAFFFEGFSKSTNWLQDQASQATRYPKEMFPTLFQWLYGPIFFTINPAFHVLSHTFTVIDLILQVVVTFLTVFMAIIVWETGLKKYSSVS